MTPAPVERRSLLTVGSAVAIVVGFILVVVGFTVRPGGSPAKRSSAIGPTISTVPLPAVDGPLAAGRNPLPGFGELAITVRTPDDGGLRAFCVMAALDAAQRGRGLMTLTDPTLGGYDGMIFVFPSVTRGSFWMRNTPMPLSIAYLGEDGGLVRSLDMNPCNDSADCPTYPARAPYRMALEVPRGGLSNLGLKAGAQVTVAGACAAKS